jgi:uncharacterized membrane protein YeaQ/YmgE (transglycosylase-associated protein family)
MGFIAWIVLGGIAGWIASMIAGNNGSQGLIGNILVGIIGAFLGGWIFEMLGGEGVTGFNVWSLVVAVAGATLLLFILRAFKRNA